MDVLTCWSEEHDVSLSTVDYWVFCFDFLAEISSKTFKDVLQFCMTCFQVFFLGVQAYHTISISPNIFDIIVLIVWQL